MNPWLDLVAAGAGILLSAHFSTVRTVLSLFQRPGWVPPPGWEERERRTRKAIENPAFPVTVSLGRSLGTLLFVLGAWNLVQIDLRPYLWWNLLIGLFLLLLLYLLGDFFPRLTARMRAENLLATSLRVQEVLQPFFLVLSLPVVRLRMMLEGLLGWDGRFDFLTQEERARVVAAQSDQPDPGDADHENAPMERQIIRAALDLGHTRVREILTPRLQVASLPLSATLEETASLVRETRYSRIPVHDGSLDHVRGVLHVKDLAVRGDEPWNLAALLRPVVFVPETQLVSQLLRALRSRQAHLAVVIDEHGGFAGIATLEDALEEIVGEIRDETDEELPVVRAVGGGQFLARGDAHPDEIREALGREEPPLPEAPEGAEADTLAGLYLALAGRLPEVGESLEAGAWEFAVLELEGNRVSQLRLTRISDQAASSRATASDEGEPEDASA